MRRVRGIEGRGSQGGTRERSANHNPKYRTNVRTEIIKLSDSEHGVVYELTLIPSPLPDPLNAASIPFCVSSPKLLKSRAGVLVPDAKGVMLNPGVINPLPPAPYTKPPLSPSNVFEYPTNKSLDSMKVGSN